MRTRALRRSWRNARKAFLFPTCNCCLCYFFTDAYTTDRLATDYDVRAGTWAVGGGDLDCSTASGLLVANSIINTSSILVTVKITCATSADIGRVVIGYTDDNNYWFLEVQPGATDGTIKLYERAAGVNTQRGGTTTLTSYNGGEAIQASLCYANGWVIAYGDGGGFGFGFAGGIAYPAFPTITTTQAGLGTGAGSSNVVFDNLIVSKHDYYDTACEECSDPCIRCDSGADPYQISMAIAGTGAAPGTIPLDDTWTLTRHTNCVWRATISGAIYLQMRWNAAFSSWDVEVVDLGATNYFRDSTPDTDCLNWAAYDVPQNNVPGSTCTVTSL